MSVSESERIEFDDQLAQVRPAGTVAVTLFTLPAGTEAAPFAFILVNDTATNNVPVDIYFDDNGTTYDATTVISSAIRMSRGVTEFFEAKLGMATAGGTIGIKIGTGDTVNVTLYGRVRF